MTVEKICIHCRRSLASSSVCSIPCSCIDTATVRGHGSWHSTHFRHSLPHVNHHFRITELPSPGWGKQLPVFLLSSQVLYLFGILFLLPIPTMSNPLPSISGESSRSSSGLNHGTAESPHHRHSRSHEREQKWINPCRIPSFLPTTSDENELIQTQPDEDIFHNIVIQAKKAETQAMEFFTDFYRDAFGGDPASDRYERLTYDFLADVMDQVNSESEEHFSSLDVDETIRSMYQALQKFAVGLEAIVLDQACYGGSFYHHFNEAEFQLKYVLCELQIAMLEKNISHNDITREIMKTEYRDLADKTTRYIRDWTIFRDYVKTLKYVHKAFEFFRARAMESSGN